MATRNFVNQTFGQILVTTGFLFLFAVVGTGLVALTFDSTRERIAENERLALLRNLNTLVPESSHDNDLFTDTLTVRDPRTLGIDTPVTIYRARLAGEPVAAIFATAAPDGYSGTIKLLVGINSRGQLNGVRVVSHRETPGLGDAVEVERSDWVLGFNGLSLGNPPLEKWKVKRDGGEFDQFTGATITPRAVVQAVKRALLYFGAHRDELFHQATAQQPASDGQ